MKNKKIQTKYLQNNGLFFAVDHYISQYNIFGHFEEDPSKKRSVTLKMLEEGIVPHQYLTAEPCKRIGFAGCFETKYLARDKNGTYYICKCQNCNKKMVLTPQLMIKHSHECLK